MKSLITILFVALTFVPDVTFGQTFSYTSIAGIPGYEEGEGIGGLINALYVVSISLAALLAVIKIIIAGVKWMLTDVVTSKGEARRDIQGALLGLIVVIGAVLILTVINPQLIDLDPTPSS